MSEMSTGQDRRAVGAVTRASAWVVDAVIINTVAIITGLGVALVTSMFHIPKPDQGGWQIVAGVVYVLWSAAYFVAFWSITGQTLGARLMQIRLVGPRGGRVGPARGVLRWIGMNLAAIPLFAGYVPVLFGRRPLPDWLARTLVVDAPEVSLVMARRAALLAEREAVPQPPPAVPR